MAGKSAEFHGIVLNAFTFVPNISMCKCVQIVLNCCLSVHLNADVSRFGSSLKSGRTFKLKKHNRPNYSSLEPSENVHVKSILIYYKYSMKKYTFRV